MVNEEWQAWRKNDGISIKRKKLSERRYDISETVL